MRYTCARICLLVGHKRKVHWYNVPYKNILFLYVALIVIDVIGRERLISCQTLHEDGRQTHLGGGLPTMRYKEYYSIVYEPNTNIGMYFDSITPIIEYLAYPSITAEWGLAV